MMIIMYTLCFYDAIFISGIGVFLFYGAPWIVSFWAVYCYYLSSLPWVM